MKLNFDRFYDFMSNLWVIALLCIFIYGLVQLSLISITVLYVFFIYLFLMASAITCGGIISRFDEEPVDADHLCCGVNFTKRLWHDFTNNNEDGYFSSLSSLLSTLFIYIHSSLVHARIFAKSLLSIIGCLLFSLLSASGIILIHRAWAMQWKARESLRIKKTDAEIVSLLWPKYALYYEYDIEDDKRKKILRDDFCFRFGVKDDAEILKVTEKQ